MGQLWVRSPLIFSFRQNKIYTWIEISYQCVNAQSMSGYIDRNKASLVQIIKILFFIKLMIIIDSVSTGPILVEKYK